MGHRTSGYQTDKRGRKQFFCRCAVCGNKKVRYVKMGPTETVSQTGSGKRKTKKPKSQASKN